jgi:hypothetical protein
VSRSVRYAIGASLILILLGAGSGYAVARWNKKDAQPNWTPDWNAVQRGWACVTGEIQDVADLFTPDRPDRDSSDEGDTAANLASDPIGSPGASGDTQAAAEMGEAESGSPLQAFLDQSQDFFASLSDEVPRLDEPAPSPSDGC